MNIDKMIDDLIKIERGYVDDPQDRGGPTKYGITIKTLDAYTKMKNTQQNIKDLQKVKAALIYKEDFYLEPGIDKLPELIQPFVFDMAVNHGPRTAIKLLQLELINYGLLKDSPDGIIGPETILASQKALAQGWRRFINALVDRRITHYRSIVKFDSSQAKFENGWIARAESFREGHLA
jgi:lysozyme family protein